MEFDNRAVKGFNNGTEFWVDTAMRYGIDEALIICSSYLDLNLKRSHSEDEKNFTREIFQAMFEPALNKAPIKIVYPYSFKKANELLESFYYNMNVKLNQECAGSIAEVIQESCYKTHFYNFENAAWKVILKYGFNRVNAVLAHQIQAQEYDGRYSTANKNWAKEFIIMPEAFDGAFIGAHACLIDSIAKYVRELNTNMVALRYALPGKEVSGEFVHGYEIKKEFKVDETTGYAIGHNPKAVNPYVCWQFKLRDHERHYNWGIYGSVQTAVDKFNARLFICAAKEYSKNSKATWAWTGK